METDEDDSAGDTSAGFKALFGNNYKEDGSSSNQSTPSKKGLPQPSPPPENSRKNSDSFPLKKQFPQPQANGELKTSEFIGAALKILTIYGN